MVDGFAVIEFVDKAKRGPGLGAGTVFGPQPAQCGRLLLFVARIVSPRVTRENGCKIEAGYQIAQRRELLLDRILDIRSFLLGLDERIAHEPLDNAR